MPKSQNIEDQIQFIDNRDFTGGLNTMDDPMNLPNNESPYILNMDITKQGAMITRFGFEETSSIDGATGQMTGALTYYKTYDEVTNDQSQDPTGAYANTYTPPAAISEAATDVCNFVPTKSLITSISIWIVTKFSAVWTLTLHDVNNVVLASKTLSPNQLEAGGFNDFTFATPVVWTSGPLHFHVTATSQDGSLKTDVDSDLSTASFVESYTTQTKGDYLLLFHSNGNAYYITNANTTPTLIGKYGNSTDVMRGTVFNNMAIFGNGTDMVQKWDVLNLDRLGGFPPNGNIFAVFEKRVFLAGDINNLSRVNYSEADDPETWNTSVNFINVTRGDGTDVRAFISTADFLGVFKDKSINGVNFSLDSTYNLTIPQLQPIIDVSSGCRATGSMQQVYGYSYFLSKDGFTSYGPSPERITNSAPLPISLKINETVVPTNNEGGINFVAKDSISSQFIGNKYICAVPIGGVMTANNIFVYNEYIKRRFAQDNWTVYNGIPVQQFITFRDTNEKDWLYFTSSSDPKLYKFNNSFSDNGFGYDRIWRSKTFQFGERTSWEYIDIEGSITENCTIYVDFNVDGVESSGNLNISQQITKSNLVFSPTTGGYIGDDYVGDNYVGGGATGTAIPMFKFKRRIRFPGTIKEGYNMFFTLRNNVVDQGWKINRYRIAYKALPEDPSYANVEK